MKELVSERIERKEDLDKQVEECDTQTIQRGIARSVKHYNLTQTAHLLKAHRQTLYCWMKQDWAKPKRDYRDYRVLQF